MGQTSGSYFSGKLYADTTKYKDAPCEAFDDRAVSENMYLIGLGMYFRRHDHAGLKFGSAATLAGMAIEYCNQYKQIITVRHGDTDDDGKCQVEYFRLQQNSGRKWFQDDKITMARVCSGTLIDRLEFRTKDGQIYGPYGGKGGREHVECAKDHGKADHLSYVSGLVAETEEGPSIIKLQLHWSSFT